MLATIIGRCDSSTAVECLLRPWGCGQQRVWMGVEIQQTTRFFVFAVQGTSSAVHWPAKAVKAQPSNTTKKTGDRNSQVSKGDLAMASKDTDRVRVVIFFIPLATCPYIYFMRITGWSCQDGRPLWAVCNEGSCGPSLCGLRLRVCRLLETPYSTVARRARPQACLALLHKSGRNSYPVAAVPHRFPMPESSPWRHSTVVSTQHMTWKLTVS